MRNITPTSSKIWRPAEHPRVNIGPDPLGGGGGFPLKNTRSLSRQWSCLRGVLRAICLLAHRVERLRRSSLPSDNTGRNRQTGSTITMADRLFAAGVVFGRRQTIAQGAASLKSVFEG